MTFHKKGNRVLIFAGLFALVGLVILIVGIVLMVKSKDNCVGGAVARASRCDYSEEAKRTGVGKFLQEVQDKYYELHPQMLIFKPGGVMLEVLKLKFKPYNPDPSNLKQISNTAKDLLNELQAMNVSPRLLKPREKKALAQVKHYLENNFGTPFDGDYFAGDFLMGPNLFCWQPICKVGSSDIRFGLGNLHPNDLSDVRLLLDKMTLVSKTFSQYIDNLKFGVKAGMVRSTEECIAGLNSFKRHYLEVSRKGDTGIYDEDYMKPIFDESFLADLKPEHLSEWKSQNGGNSVNDSIREFALEYIGKPVHNVIRYLETENLQHCVPSNVSSGLATLPLSYVYVNGTKTDTVTSKKLPLHEPLDGKKAYESILPFFTTISKSPDQVHELGNKMLKKLYPEVLEIARSVTGKSDNDTAKDLFIKRLNQSDMFFNEEPFPANESDKKAHDLCSSVQGAMKYCPTRWETMQKWFAEARRVMSMLDPQTVDMFHFSGPKHTTPNCPVDMAPNFNPSSGAQSYRRSTKDCRRNSYYNIPFFLDRPKKFEEWSVNAHEARPGHHTQVQGLVEHFRDSCGGVISWLDSSTYYTSFTEGWALYAENPLIARETKVYDNEPFQKYGMLKWQVWRALRLIVDTGLHYKGFSRDDALKYFADYAWDTSDSAEKEVTRYQSDPGQATAYMIGQLKIIELREYAMKELGEKFDLKDFHFYLLAQGSAPLSYLEESIHEYVRCAKDEKQEGCDDVLNPVAPEEDQLTEFVGVIGERSYEPPEKPPLDDYM